MPLERHDADAHELACPRKMLLEKIYGVHLYVPEPQYFQRYDPRNLVSMQTDLGSCLICLQYVCEVKAGEVLKSVS